MTPDQCLAYLCGAIAGMFSRPLGWVIATPAGWKATSNLCQRRGGR